MIGEHFNQPLLKTYRWSGCKVADRYQEQSSLVYFGLGNTDTAMLTPVEILPKSTTALDNEGTSEPEDPR